jgi:putative Mn2+ efflux pump MntP
MVSFMMTAAGMVFGRKLGELLGRRAELLGGVVLIGIGIKILMEHMV